MPDNTTADSFEPRFEHSTHPTEPARRAAILADPGFGRHFSDHMVLIDWTEDDGWHDPRVVPYGPLSLYPACAVLHYAQEIFEGIKAYRHGDGSLWVFRPDQNAARFARSAARMALPELPADWFIGAIDALVAVDAAWVPAGAGKSLYMRPFMFASEATLVVEPARQVTFAVIASPVAGYVDGGGAAMSVWAAEGYVRAAVGGTGRAKTGGNYAASLQPMQEAAARGADQVVFLDSREQRYVEELGGMNLYFVYADGQIVTPDSDSILEGVTRSSLHELATELGHSVQQRQFALSEWVDGVASGQITEVFACGTAAVITPVGSLQWSGGVVGSPTGTAAGPVATALRRALVELQYGRVPDGHGWLHRVVV